MPLETAVEAGFFTCFPVAKGIRTGLRHRKTEAIPFAILYERGVSEWQQRSSAM